MPYFALIIMYYHVKIACYQRAISTIDRDKPLHPTVTSKSSYKLNCYWPQKNIIRFLSKSNCLDTTI